MFHRKIEKDAPEKTPEQRISAGRHCKDTADDYLTDAEGQDSRLNQILQENPKGKLKNHRKIEKDAPEKTPEQRISDGRRCKDTADDYLTDAEGQDSRLNQILQENPKGKLKNHRKIEKDAPEKTPEQRISDGRRCKDTAEAYLTDAKGEDWRLNQILQENPKGKLKKEAVSEAKGIRDRNKHIISHLSDRREVIADAIKAKEFEERPKFIKEHGGGPDSPKWDKKKYKEFSDELQGFKKSLSEIDHYIDKLSINNREISELLGEKQETKNGEQVTIPEKQTAGQKIKDFFLARLQKPEH